jgi:pilus assembly protein CpaE
MEKPLQILFVGSDPLLPEEVQFALQSMGPWRVYPHYANTPEQALEMARDRQPNLVCMELEGDYEDWRTFAKDIQLLAPRTVLAVLYDPGKFNPQESESSIIISMLRANIQDFLRRPLSSTEFRQLLDRLFLERNPGKNSMGTVISIVSNKGGVGKSTVSVNLAVELAMRHPGKVLLVDASIQLGICALMLDLKPESTIVDAVRAKERLDDSLLRRLCLKHPSGLQVLAAPVDAVQAAEVNEASVARILNLARRVFDYVVVDTFPMLDSLIVTALDISDLVFVLMQGTVPNVVGASRFFPVLETLGVARDRQRIVLSRNHPSFSGELSVADIEGRIGRKIQYVVPYTKGILVSLNSGNPYMANGIRMFGFGNRLVKMADEAEAVRGNLGVAV